MPHRAFPVLGFCIALLPVAGQVEAQGMQRILNAPPAPIVGGERRAVRYGGVSNFAPSGSYQGWQPDTLCGPGLTVSPLGDCVRLQTQTFDRRGSYD